MKTKINIEALEQHLAAVTQEQFTQLRLIAAGGPVVSQEPKERYLAHMKRCAARNQWIYWSTVRFHALLEAMYLTGWGT